MALVYSRLQEAWSECIADNVDLGDPPVQLLCQGPFGLVGQDENNEVGLDPAAWSPVE